MLGIEVVRYREELLGLRFKISPFSFFQTNSLGAEVLYSTARDYIGETKDKVIFDLYSGTGTIAQILAPVAQKVAGVEIVEEAVQAAQDMGAKAFLPAHAGKFSLAYHSWDDPFRRVTAAAADKKFSLVTPVIGDVVFLDQPMPGFSRWWEQMT